MSVCITIRCCALCGIVQSETKSSCLEFKGLENAFSVVIKEGECLDCCTCSVIKPFLICSFAFALPQKRKGKCLSRVTDCQLLFSTADF